MQPLENGDGIVEMEEKIALPSLAWDSTCDDSSDPVQIFPRIGDQYQVKIPPFDPSRFCYWNDENESKGSNVKNDDYEELFAEALSVPIMQITISSPKGSLAESEKDCINEPSVESPDVTKELIKTEVKLEHGFERESSEERDEKCAPMNNFGDNMPSIQDHVDSSMVYTNIEIPVTKGDPDDVGIESADTVNNNNAPDALSSGKVRRKRKGKGGWKRVKKAKVELSKASKQKFEPSGPNDHGEKHLNSRSFIMVPGSPPEAWTKTEEDVFLLALYIFGKNFTSVQSFMETKKMKDILVYYYTKFYGTESYCRWAESRKIKSRKCFQGQRIFSGWRQQELSTRLLPHVPDHLKDKIPDAMKGFTEGRITIEEFANELKTLVGLSTFVQAIGIGKGSHDLTAPLMDPMKTNQVVSARCEIPMGRACSSLSAEEIVKFLTGDYRLSKARSNDLFWEAVWPRLLARGWHSEQPDDQTCLGSKQSLVFLIPGVQKFSRRILVKGVHYFDSLSEVLSRVALEPRLLDPPKPEMGEMMGSKLKPECLWTAEILEEQNDKMRESPCYLQPRYHKSDIESYVFTIIDTSLVSEGEDTGCVRQNRMLPTEDLSACLQYDSGETEDLNSELLVSMEANVCKPSILDPLSTYPSESIPALTHNENSAELDEVLTASPSPSSAPPSSQSEQNGNYSTGLMLQTGASAPTSEEGTVYSSYSGRGRALEPNEERCSYPTQDTCDVVSHNELPFSCNNLSSISKQRRLNVSSCGDCEEAVSGLIGSNAATDHKLIASGKEVKFETRKETPSSVVETCKPEKGKCIITSNQSDDMKSDKDLSTLQGGCWSSFSRTSNNALYSKLYRFKSQKSPDLASSQDPSESLILSTISGMGTAHMEPTTKSEEISFSQHDNGHSQEKETNMQQQSSSPTYGDTWKSLYSQSEQESRHYQEQLNDLRAGLGGSPFVEGVNFQNSNTQKIPIHSQEHPKQSGKAQSVSHVPGDGQTHEMLENNAQGSQVEGRRQSTRNRPLTAKALEAFASGFYTAKRRKGVKNTANTDTSHTSTIPRKCIYDPGFLPNASSLDNSDITIVDTSMESVDGEGNNDYQVGHKARNGHKRRRTHAVMKVPKTSFYTEILERDGKEDVVSGIMVSE